MAGNLIKFELNRAGVGELLKSPAMQSILEGHARRIAGSSGEVEVYVAGTRAVAEAKQYGLNNSMLKGMRG